jgi:hypothetical protein
LPPYFDFVVSDELLGDELLGLELLPDALPLVLESLEPDELGVDDELDELGELDGVEDDELDELGELGVDDPEALEELGELESRLELEPDIEPDGEDGELLEPVAEPEREAPGPLAFLSQP